MATITLDELKAENAAIESKANNEVVNDEKEIIKDDYVEVKEEVKADTDDNSTEDNDEEEAELESWQLTEDTEASVDDQKSGFVPNHEAAKRRKKAQALKGELNDTKDENKELLARIAALESGNAPQAQPQSQPLVKPTREQFDYDDEAYDAAVDAYYDAKFDQKITNHQAVSTEKQTQEAKQQAYLSKQKQSLEDHYERAQKLVDEGKVTDKAYKDADILVRRTLDATSPGQGDNLANALISTLNSLGEGSEKVMFQLGANPAKLQELQNKLVTDPSGLSASAFLGQLQSQIQNPSKRRSQAPKPSANANGEGGGSGQAGAASKAFNKLDSDDVQGRITMKRKAKSQGIDTSNW